MPRPEEKPLAQLRAAEDDGRVPQRTRREPMSNFRRSNAVALVLAALFVTGGADAQPPAKGSPEHIKATTQRIDGGTIRANATTSKDWPTIGLDYAETRYSRLNQINTSNVKDLG